MNNYFFKTILTKERMVCDSTGCVSFVRKTGNRNYRHLTQSSKNRLSRLLQAGEFVGHQLYAFHDKFFLKDKP